MTQSNFQSNTWKPSFDIFEDRQGLRQTLIQFQIPLLRLAIISISRNEITHRIRPNPISNPIHVNPGFKIIKGRQDLRYTPIQFQIPILRFAIISIPRNDITHRIWPDPISNPIHGNPGFDIFEHMHDLRYTQSNSKSQYLGLSSYQYLEMK